MKKFVTLALGILPALAMAEGGSVVSGGREAVIHCSQNDSLTPAYEVNLTMSLIGDLTVKSASRTYRHRLSCTRNSDQFDRRITCEYQNLYRIYIQNEQTAAVFNGRGFVKNLACEIR